MLSSCSDLFNCIQPRGPVVVEKRLLANSFDAIDLRLGARVFVNYGNSREIFIEAPESLLSNIQTYTSGSELIIEQRRCMDNRNDEIVITLSQEYLRVLTISGSGSIILDDYVEADRMDMIISGSGNIMGEVYANDVRLVISGSGNIELDGHCDIQRIAISGSGNILNRNLICKEADVRISGSGNAWVHPLRNLSVNISGSGNIHYLGNPQVFSSITGTGKIIPLANSN